MDNPAQTGRASTVHLDKAFYPPRCQHRDRSMPKGVVLGRVELSGSLVVRKCSVEQMQASTDSDD